MLDQLLPAGTNSSLGGTEPTEKHHLRYSDAAQASGSKSNHSRQSPRSDRQRSTANFATHTTLNWSCLGCRYGKSPPSAPDWINSFAPKTTTLVSDGSSTATLSTDLVLDGNQTVSGTLSVSGNSTHHWQICFHGNKHGPSHHRFTNRFGGQHRQCRQQWTGLVQHGHVDPMDERQQCQHRKPECYCTPQTSTGLLLLTPSGGGADMIVSLAAVASYPTGFTPKIRRNEDYTGTNDSITSTPMGPKPWTGN